MAEGRKPKSPSKVRDALESRVRKLAATYSLDERIKALDEIQDIAYAHRVDLIARRDKK